MLPERHDNSEELLRRVREAVGPKRAERWFGPQTAIRFDGDHVTVAAATSYLLKYIQSRQTALIAELAEAICGTAVRLSWSVDEALAVGAADSAGNHRSADGGSERATGGQGGGSSEPPKQDEAPLSGDLERFHAGECNRVAFNAATVLAKKPRAMSGMMVLFGPIGCGKTHLLEGVATSVRKARAARVLSINGSAFGNLFKQAMSEYATAGFRQRFHGVDLLCIDDLDFFESKRSFQDELLQTIDRIEARGGTVLATASAHPKMLTGLPDQLISRLLSGPVCRIEQPSDAVRYATAKSRAKALGADISAKALKYVSERFSGSLREVIGAVNTLHAHALSSGERIKISSARAVLAALERDVAKVVRIVDIEAAVSQLFGVPTSEMRSSRRSRSVSQPRQVAMYLARKLTSGAYKEIGQHFGGRNHSTVMAAERSVSRMIANREEIRIGFQNMSVDDLVHRLESDLRVG